MSRWTMLLVGLVATLALLAAACGPTDEPDEEATSTPAQPTATPLQITGSSPTAVPDMDDDDDMDTDDDDDDADMPDANTSVSGIPLDPDAKTGGTLQLAYRSNNPLNPWEEAAGPAFDVGHLLNNMLIKPRTWGTEEDFRNNAFFQLTPDLASGWEQSDDGLAWSFNLRSGIEWSDGTPLTCTDVKWSFDTIRRADEAGLLRSPRKTHYLAMDSINCVDDLTVVFNLRYPKPAVLEVIGQPYNIIFPAHIYHTEFLNTGRLDSMREQPSEVTSGAFTVTSYIPGEGYTFERNDDYWDAPLPYVDGVEMTFLSRSNIPPALRTGSIHVGDSHGYTGGQALTLIEEHDDEIYKIYDRVIASSFSPGLFLNKEREPWNDPAVNTAFALAIDNQKYVTSVQQDLFELPTGCGFYPTSEWAMPQDRCAAIPGYADVFGDTPEERSAQSDRDKARAREILEEAGYTGDNALDLNMTVWSVIQADGPAIQLDLQEIGVNVELEIPDSSTTYTKWSNADFDVGVHSFWIAGIDPDVTLYEHFYTGSDRNYNKYSNPEFDNLVNQMSRTLDKEERKELAWQAMELALTEVGKVVISHGSYYPMVSANLKGYMPAPNYLAGYGPLKRYSHVWLDE